MKKAVFTAAALLFFGCQSREGRVIAKVGKFTITEAEFRRKLGDVAPEFQNYAMTPNGRRQFLDVLIRQKMILAAASDSEVRRSGEYKSQLDKLKAEMEESLASSRESLLIQLWLEDLKKKGVLSVSDQEIRQYYDQHPTEVEVRHILLATPEEAEAAFRKVQSGHSFASIAQEKSIDAETVKAGGKMPPRIYGEIIPELEDVVFRIKIGETVGPVRSKFGYHIVRKDAERRPPFQKVEDRIRYVLEKQKLDQHLQSLQTRYHVEVMKDVQFN